MTDEIKEIELDHFNNINELKQTVETWIKEDDMYWNRWFSLYDLKTLLDYITNLQQENKAKTHQIEVLEEIVNYERNIRNDKLQQENEFLKLNNPEMNIEHFRIVKENKRKIDNLRKENERLKEDNLLIESANKLVSDNLHNYKSRCQRAIEYINFVINHYKEQLKTPIEDTYFDSDVNRKGYILSIIAYLQTILDILNGSDEK